MTNRKSAIAASVKSASRGKAAFVFASSTEGLPKDAEEMTAKLANAKYAVFDCTACGTSMQSRADTNPFCVTCGAGDGEVHQHAGDAKPNVTAKTELVALNCDLCTASTILDVAVVTAITSSSKSGPTPIHCSCCGNPMVISASADKQDGEPSKMADSSVDNSKLKTPSINASEDEVDDDIDLDALGSLEDMGDEDDGDLELDENGIEEDSAEDITSNPTTLITPPGPAATETFNRVQPEDALELEPFSIEEDIYSDASLPVTTYDEVETPPNTEGVLTMENEDVGDPLVDALSMDDTEMALAFVKANGRLVAMKGHVAIATLSPTSKTPNAKLIDSKALQAAAKHSVSTEGLRAGLTSIGFSLVKVPVTSKATLERRVQEITAKAAAVDAVQQKAFAQAFALAAAGLNRGQWKGVGNPLRAAMETELARAGVEHPRRVVSSVFDAAGLSYAETLLATSNRLVKMSASARAELSEVLNMTSNVSPEDEHDAESDSDVDQSTVESRFAKGGKLTATVSPRLNSSAPSVSAASAILAGKAELNFSF